jgi:hypothetical protein
VPVPKPFSTEKKNEWAEKIRQQQASGLSIEKWCNENQIKPYVFHYWKKRLSPDSLSRSNFTELVDQKGCSLVIEYQGVRAHFESSTLKQCLAVLKELKC